jgi:hypothetical protein
VFYEVAGLRLHFMKVILCDGNGVSVLTELLFAPGLRTGVDGEEYGQQDGIHGKKGFHF